PGDRNAAAARGFRRRHFVRSQAHYALPPSRLASPATARRCSAVHLPGRWARSKNHFDSFFILLWVSYRSISRGVWLLFADPSGPTMLRAPRTLTNDFGSKQPPNFFVRYLNKLR